MGKATKSERGQFLFPILPKRPRRLAFRVKLPKLRATERLTYGCLVCGKAVEAGQAYFRRWPCGASPIHAACVRPIRREKNS